MKATDRFEIPGVACRLAGETLPVINLSVSGLFVACERPPLPGQVVALELLVGDRRYPLTCRVTWLNRPESPRAKELPAGCGLAIASIDLAAKLAIVDLVKRAAEALPGENSRR